MNHQRAAVGHIAKRYLERLFGKRQPGTEGPSAGPAEAESDRPQSAVESKPAEVHPGHETSRKPKRAVVISNCQCLPLAGSLTTLSADTIFDFWGVHLIDPANRQSEIKSFVAKARADYDYVLAIPLGEDYFDLATACIAETFAQIPLIRISNIYFSGFHPDQTYIGGLSQRVAGPLGDAHSKIAIHGFMTGLTIAETRALFCEQTFARLGYFQEFHISLETLRERDRAVDVSVTRFLAETLGSALCFYSFNHPTPTVFSAYAADVMQHLVSRGLTDHSGFPADPALCTETLAGSVIFPVYPEIAAHHGVPQIGSYTFKPEGAWVNPLNLNSFLAREFEAFAAVGRETLALSHAAQNIAAHFKVLDL